MVSLAMGGTARAAEAEQAERGRAVREAKPGGGTSPFKVTPASVDWRDVAPGEVYTQELSIRNVDRVPHVLHVGAPVTHEFTVVPPEKVLLAPGMAVTAIVSFKGDGAEGKSKLKGAFHDRLILRSDRGAMEEVGLHAHAPRAWVSLSQSLVDFGRATVDCKYERDVILRNTGTVHCTFAVQPGEVSHSDVQVEPKAGKLKPGEEKVLKVSLRLAEASYVKSDFSVVCQGGNLSEAEGVIPMTVLARAQPHFVRLVEAGAHDAVPSVVFGSVYYENTVVREAELWNDGPDDVQFSSTVLVGDVRDDEDDDSGVDMDFETKGKLGMKSMFRAKMGMKRWRTKSQACQISPRVGTIPSGGRIKLKFTFTPNMPTGQKGFEATLRHVNEEDKEYVFTAFLNFKPGGHPEQSETSGAQVTTPKVRVPIGGRGVRRRISITAAAGDGSDNVSVNALQFGQCDVNKRVSRHVKVENLNANLPVRFETSRGAQFRTEPRISVIGPRSSVQLEVIYAPRNFGKHHETVVLESVAEVEGAQRVPMGLIKCAGMSLAASERVRVGGATASAKDFEATMRRDPPGTEGTFTKRTKFIRTGLAESDPSLLGTNPLALNVMEYSMDQRNKAKYRDFVKKSHEARTKANAEKVPKLGWRYNAVDDLNLAFDGEGAGGGGWNGKTSVDIGLGETLTPPMPALPKEAEKLWLDDSALKKISVARPKARSLLLDDEENQFRSYSDKPKDAKTAQEIQRKLSNEEVMNIVAGPRVLDFGKCYVNCSITRPFLVTNGNKRHILVSLKTSTLSGLKQSKKMRQIIPPGATAGFSVVLNVLEAGEYNRKLTYEINNDKEFTVDVTAVTTPMVLKPSLTDLYFRFSPKNWAPHVDLPFFLKNPTGGRCQYYLEFSSLAFSCSHETGFVDANSTAEIVLRYLPIPGADVTGTLSIFVVGGEPLRLKLTGEVLDGKCVTKSKEVDLGIVPMQTTSEAKFMVSSVGGSDAMFLAKVTRPDMTVSPSRGVLPPGKSMELTLQYFDPKTHDDHETISLGGALDIEVRGGKVLTLPIMGQATVPKCEVNVHELDFGACYVGTSTIKEVIVFNHGDCQATLLFNLDGSDDGNTHDSIWVRSLRKTWPIPGVEPLARLEGDGLNTVRLYVPAKKQVHLEFNYRPLNVEEHDFHMSFVPLGLSKMPDLMRCRVKARGLHPRLNLDSSTNIEFGLCTVPNEGTKVKPAEVNVRATNNEKQDLEWRLGLPKNVNDAGYFGPDYSFGCRETQGVIRAGETLQLTFYGVFRDAGLYEVELPLYLLPGDSATNENEPYLTFSLSGTGVFPRLSFDRPHVHFPVMPVGTKMEALFYIHNHRIDSSMLSIELPDDQANVPLSVSFPEGEIIGLARERLPVLVTCTFARPGSFTVNAEVSDESGNKFYIPISAMSEVCFLTNFSVLHRNLQSGTYEIKVASSAPINLRWPKTFVQRITSNHEMDEGLPKEGETMLLHLLNMTVAGSAPISQLPGDFIKSNGELLIDLIKAVSGKVVPGCTDHAVPSDAKVAAMKLLNMYDTVILFLIQHGAMLNGMQPESLLTKGQLLKTIEHRMSLIEDGLSNKIMAQKDVMALMEKSCEDEVAWDAHVAHTWNKLILQVIKIFMLNRLTVKKLESLPVAPSRGSGAIASTPFAPSTTPGLTPAPASPAVGDGRGSSPALVASALADSMVVQGSNLFSTGEGVLLQWLTKNMCDVFGRNGGRVVNFDSDFSDGTVLLACLANYLPDVYHQHIPKFTGVWRNMDELDSGLCLALVADLIGHLKMGLKVTVHELKSADARDNLILSLILFQLLPQFVPKAVIELLAPIKQAHIKQIELTNPSKNVLSYDVVMVGTHDFDIPRGTVKIEPRSTVMFPVQFIPSVGLPVRGRITFTGRRLGGATPSTLVFNLIGNCDVNAPVAPATTVSAKLFESKRFDVPFTNPFKSDGEFRVTLEHQFEMAVPYLPSQSKRKNAKRPKKANSRVAKVQYPYSMGNEKKMFRLKSGDTFAIPFLFHPLALGAHKCRVILDDDNLGRAVLDVVGEVHLGAVFDAPIKLSVDLAKMPIVCDLNVVFENSMLENAKRGYTERHPLAKGKPTRELLDAMTRAFDSVESIVYDVEHQGEYVSAPSTLTLQRVVGEAKHTHGMRKPDSPREGSPNSIPLLISPPSAGVYPGTLLLSSGYDTRIIEYEISVTSSGQRGTFDLSAPVRTTVVQEVPVVNQTDRDMTVSAAILGPGNSAFDGKQNFVVGANQSEMYKLSFSPKIQGKRLEADLEFSNDRGERWSYGLSGFGEEAAAEKHLAVECKQREAHEISLEVPNALGAVQCVYNVETDLDCLSGPATLKVGSAGTATYNLVISPTQTGTVFGTLTFSAGKDKPFVWYSVEVTGLRPPPLQALELTTTVRQPVAVDITINNPSASEAINFSVLHVGDGLSGPSEFQLSPGQMGYTYELIYEPAYSSLRRGPDGEKIGTPMSGSVHFISEQHGEFWYELELNCYAAGFADSLVIPCDYGKAADCLVRVQNPQANEELHLEPELVDFSNAGPSNFSLADTDALVTLPAGGYVDMPVRYTPTDVWGAKQEATLVLRQPGMDPLMYKLVGQPGKPGIMPETKVGCVTGDVAAGQVNFTNPSDSSLSLRVSIEGDDSQGDKAPLRLGISKLLVTANGRGAIPFTFRPTDNEQTATATIVAEADSADGDVSRWCFPVSGLTEMPMPDNMPKLGLVAKLRQPKLSSFSVLLAGLVAPCPSENFSCELLPRSDRDAQHVIPALIVDPLNFGLEHPGAMISPDTELRFKLTYTPTVLSTTTVDVVMEKKGGARWRFPLSLETTEPDRDGIVEIQAPVGKPTHQKFTLVGAGATPGATFQARFAYGISPSFELEPRSGAFEELDPPGTLSVVYSPTEYGRVDTDVITVESSDGDHWTFDVRGTQPAYQPPAGRATLHTQPTADTKLRRRERPANFLRENLKAPLTSKEQAAEDLRYKKLEREQERLKRVAFK